MRPYVANSLFMPTDDQERKERVIYAATMYVFGARLCQQELPCKLEDGTVAYLYVYSSKGVRQIIVVRRTGVASPDLAVWCLKQARRSLRRPARELDCR